ncbi:MAG TPA: M15 family metallopeptidase [Actinomycetota bacterium]
MTRARLLAAVLASGLLAGCTSATGTSRAEVSTALSPRVSSPSVVPYSSATPLPHRFHATIGEVPSELVAQMRGTTWRPGCPLPISSLRLLSFRYWGYDGRVHEGPMVVNASVASGLASVFRELFRARFPIKHVALARRFRPNADPNTTRSITASFNCRPIVTPAGAGSTWSQHAYGLAVDVNPLQNPYVAADGYVRNRFARPYRDRSQDLPGMIHDGDPVVRAFAAIGWEWGGHWSSGKDYMHFSANGN